MNGQFKLIVGVAPDMLRNPYTARCQQLFGSFSLRIGDFSPTKGVLGGEFLLVLLLHWNRAIHSLAEGKSRGAKLFFTVCEGEIWVRTTPKSLWKVSYVDHLQGKRIRAEVLCVPERLEAGLLSVSRKVLTGAEKAGIWTPDCVEMEQFLRDPDEYMRQVEALKNRVGYAQQSPSATAVFPQRNPQPHREPPVNSRFSQQMKPQPLISPVLSAPVERRHGTSPLFCPQCTGVLRPWGENQTSQTCPYCKHEVRTM